MDIINGLHILTSYPSPTTNSIECTLGDNFTDNTETDQAQFIQQVGFCSRPSNAVAGISAPEATVIKDSGNRDIIIGSRDTTSQSIYGNLNAGEFCCYAPGANGTSQANITGKQDGSVTLYTTDDNTASGNGVSLGISPTQLFFNAPWGKLIFDATGLHITTNSGASFDMTGVADPTTGNAVTITTGNFTANSGTINLGPTTGVNLPALVSILPAAIAGVPVLGAGVGSVVVEAVASPVVSISAGI